MKPCTDGIGATSRVGGRPNARDRSVTVNERLSCYPRKGSAPEGLRVPAEALISSLPTRADPILTKGETKGKRVVIALAATTIRVKPDPRAVERRSSPRFGPSKVSGIHPHGKNTLKKPKARSIGTTM